MKRLILKPENIDKAAKLIADFCAERLAAKGAYSLAPSLPPEASQAVTEIDCTLANNQASSVPVATIEAETLTEAEQAEIETETEQTLAEIEAQAESHPLRLHGLRLLTQIHLEIMDELNAKHKAEFEEYRTSGDKFIPMTAETENLIANARAVHSQAPESWEQPLTKSQKRKRYDQVNAATYRD